MIVSLFCLCVLNHAPDVDLVKGYAPEHRHLRPLYVEGEVVDGRVAQRHQRRVQREALGGGKGGAVVASASGEGRCGQGLGYTVAKVAGEDLA